jgi:hypothetical protein
MFRSVLDFGARYRIALAALALAFFAVGTNSSSAWAWFSPMTGCYYDDNDANGVGPAFCPGMRGMSHSPQPAPQIPRIDPCFKKLNALRPCALEQEQSARPAGVDPSLVGTWELPVADGLWVLEILGNGTYRFHSEAGAGAPTHAGSFSASDGHWSLQASTGYTDGGAYSLQASDIWKATGNLGTGAWRRRA